MNQTLRPSLRNLILAILAVLIAALIALLVHVVPTTESSRLPQQHRRDAILKANDSFLSRPSAGANSVPRLDHPDSSLRIQSLAVQPDRNGEPPKRRDRRREQRKRKAKDNRTEAERKSESGQTKLTRREPQASSIEIFMGK